MSKFLYLFRFPAAGTPEPVSRTETMASRFLTISVAAALMAGRPWPQSANSTHAAA